MISPGIKQRRNSEFRLSVDYNQPSPWEGPHLFKSRVVNITTIATDCLYTTQGNTTADCLPLTPPFFNQSLADQECGVYKQHRGEVARALVNHTCYGTTCLNSGCTSVNFTSSCQLHLGTTISYTMTTRWIGLNMTVARIPGFFPLGSLKFTDTCSCETINPEYVLCPLATHNLASNWGYW